MNAFFSWQHAIVRSSLEPTTKLVLLTISTHMANDGSGCFPSYKTIAEESGLNRSTVIRHVYKGAAEGYLQIVERPAKNGAELNLSNLYRPLMPKQEVVAHSNHLVAQGDHPVAQNNHGVVAQGDPNYSPSLTTQITADLDEQYSALKNMALTIRTEWYDEDKVHTLWKTGKYRSQIMLMLQNIPSLARDKNWTDCEARFLPAFSKVMTDGVWKNYQPKAVKEKDPWAAGYNPLGNVN